MGALAVITKGKGQLVLEQHSVETDLTRLRKELAKTSKKLGLIAQINSKRQDGKKGNAPAGDSLPTATQAERLNQLITHAISWGTKYLGALEEQVNIIGRMEAADDEETLNLYQELLHEEATRADTFSTPYKAQRAQIEALQKSAPQGFADSVLGSFQKASAKIQAAKSLFQRFKKFVSESTGGMVQIG
jgi:hypothetical protein